MPWCGQKQQQQQQSKSHLLAAMPSERKAKVGAERGVSLTLEEYSSGLPPDPSDGGQDPHLLGGIAPLPPPHHLLLTRPAHAAPSHVVKEQKGS